MLFFPQLDRCQTSPSLKRFARRSGHPCGDAHLVASGRGGEDVLVNVGRPRLLTGQFLGSKLSRHAELPESAQRGVVQRQGGCDLTEVIVVRREERGVLAYVRM